MPPSSRSKDEFGRGERVIPGLWRLRLTLPLPGVPHCNAWAIRSGDRIVLVDCGMYERPAARPLGGRPAGAPPARAQAAAARPASMAQLENAMAQVGLRLEQVEHLVITHAHLDHWGQAGPVIDRSGAELWLHPNHRHGTAAGLNPEAALANRLEIGRQSGVSERDLELYAQRLRELPSGIERIVTPDHPLVDGVEIETDLGTWYVYETPGHAPSHVCLYQPEHRILISGDHLLGRIALYFDYGWTPDPIGEFLDSLERVDRLDARLALPGHARPFIDVHAHVLATRATVERHLAAARTAVYAADADGATAIEIAPAIAGEPLTPESAPWRLTETLCVLSHLERRGELARRSDGGVERWHRAGA